jgi:hypothetical protein
MTEKRLHAEVTVATNGEPNNPNPSPLPFHEVAGLFPLLQGPEFEALKQDIAEHGQRERLRRAGG